MIFPLTLSDEPADFVPSGFSYVRAVNSIPEPEPPPSLGIIIEPETEPITIYINTSICDCLTFIKQFSEKLIGKSLYYPFYLWENYQNWGLKRLDEPEIGSIIITTENKYYGHAGVVASLSEDMIYVLDKNYKPCKVSYRELPKDDGIIVGFLK